MVELFFFFSTEKILHKTECKKISLHNSNGQLCLHFAGWLSAAIFLLSLWSIFWGIPAPNSSLANLSISSSFDIIKWIHFKQFIYIYFGFFRTVLHQERFMFLLVEATSQTRFYHRFFFFLQAKTGKCCHYIHKVKLQQWCIGCKLSSSDDTMQSQYKKDQRISESVCGWYCSAAHLCVLPGVDPNIVGVAYNKVRLQAQKIWPMLQTLSVHSEMCPISSICALVKMSYNDLSTGQKSIRCKVCPSTPWLRLLLLLWAFIDLFCGKTEPNQRPHFHWIQILMFSCGWEGREQYKPNTIRLKTRRTLFPSACQRLFEAFLFTSPLAVVVAACDQWRNYRSSEVKHR